RCRSRSASLPLPPPWVARATPPLQYGSLALRLPFGRLRCRSRSASLPLPPRGVAVRARPAQGLHCREMSDLWPRIEPLLARGEKPARYIGMEMGTGRGSLAPRHGSGRAAFLLLYPDTYEIGLPNQGLQILYELLNERDDSVAERAYAPWTDMEAAMRAAGVPLFSVDTHRAARDFDVLAFNLSAELVYTNLLNLVD